MRAFKGSCRGPLKGSYRTPLKGFGVDRRQLQSLELVRISVAVAMAWGSFLWVAL